MNSRRPLQYFITALFLLIILVAFIASVFYTFAVGTPTATPTASANPNQTSSSIPIPEPASQYPEQAHITDGIIVFGIIIVAIIIFGCTWGRRISIPRVPKPSKK